MNCPGFWTPSWLLGLGQVSFALNVAAALLVLSLLVRGSRRDG